MRSTSIPNTALWLIVMLLGLIALRPFFGVEVTASADSARFDHVTVISPLFLYKGKQGLLLLDKRNGNAWFMGREGELEVKYADPVFITHIPFEKLDERQ